VKQNRVLGWFVGFAIFCVSSFALSDEDQKMRVGMPVPGQQPFFWKNEAGEITGIYPDTLRAVASELNLNLEFIPLSQARLVRHFMIGELDIEIGVSPQIKDPSAMAIVSKFSRPFGIANEVIIFDPELSFPAFILKDLKGQKVATVRGSVAPSYLVREDFSSSRQIALRVSRGWNQVGLMREALAMHYKSALNLDYKVSLPYQSNPISFRLHYQRRELLIKIDASLERLEREGALEEIVCKYLCGS
jgi:ABC-type amino acid transport substrate-binding protein